MRDLAHVVRGDILLSYLLFGPPHERSAFPVWYAPRLCGDASHAFGGWLAILTAWCDHHDIAYQGVPVGTIKRFIAGKGNADKAAVIAAVRARGFHPADDNEADALATLLWAIETQGGVR